MNHSAIILVAMEFEFSAVVDAAQDHRKMNEKELASLDALGVSFDGGSAILARCGTGPVAAAITLSTLAARSRIQHVLLLGVGGALSSDLALGDLVVADEIIQHDAMFFGASGAELMAPGELHLSLPPEKRRPAPFPVSSPRLLHALRDIEPFAVGQFVSGSSFAGTRSSKDELRTRFPRALMVDMEAAGVALAARRLNLELSVAKTVADRLDPAEGVEDDYLLFRDRACRNAARIAARFMQGLPEMSESS